MINRSDNCGWIDASIELPVVGVGDEMECFVSVIDSRGRQFLLICHYVNKPIPDDEDEIAIMDCYGKPIDIVGWYKVGCHPDYSEYYEPVAGVVTHWQQIVFPASPTIDGVEQ